MPYFTIEKTFLIPSFDLEVKEETKIRKYLSFLESSGVGKIISNYINNKTNLGGRPGYNYYRLFATILYGFAFKRYTLRELEDACKHNLRFIFLMEQNRPSYTKFCDFINRVIAPNEKKIFSTINFEIMRLTGITCEEVYIDGTKFEANANKFKFVWKPNRHHRNLSIKVNEIINKYSLISNYNDEYKVKSSTIAYALTHLDEKYDSLPLKEYINIRKALSSLLDKCLEYEEKEEICGPNRNSYYKTDRDATAMALKADYYSGLGSNMHAAYNVQHLVSMGYIFAYYVSQSRTDLYDFIDTIETFFNLYGFYPNRICADAGYGSLENYRYMKKHGIVSYVKHQSWEGNKSGRNPDCYHLNDDDTVTCLNGNTGYQVDIPYRHPRKKEAVFYRVNGCNSCGWMPFCKKYMTRLDEDFKIFEVVKDLERFKYESHANLLTPKGIEIRVNRSIQVEGTFGIEKQDYRYQRTRRRGIDNVSTEIMLNVLGMNIAKLFRFFETGKLNSYWTAPEGIETESFKKPNMKRLARKGRRINAQMIDAQNKKT